MTRILQKFLQPAQTPRLAALLLALLEAAQFQRGLALRLRQIEAVGQTALDFLLEMMSQFFVQLPFHSAATEK